MSVVISPSQLGDNLGGAILEKLSASYELHTTNIALNELTDDLSPSIQVWRNNPGKYIVDPIQRLIFAMRRLLTDLSPLRLQT